MAIHIIIDGYNLIRQSKRLSGLDLQDIQLGRDTLVDMLAAYKKTKSHRITVVFDGNTDPLFAQQQDRRKGITIIFSHKGESADSVIKKIARKERQRALVVSSDQDIVQSAATSGAATVSANDFEMKLAMSYDIDGFQSERDVFIGWRPTTKKKGPSRRLSKRQRMNSAKIRKL